MCLKSSNFRTLTFRNLRRWFATCARKNARSRNKGSLFAAGCVLVAVLVLFLGANAEAQSPRGAELFGGVAAVSLAWKPSPKATGYRVYYRRKGENYIRSQDSGGNTICKVVGLNRKTTYWFVATAYNAGGESGPSNEVFYRTASSPSYK